MIFIDDGGRVVGVVENAPPLLGQHTDDVLTAAGYSDDEIRGFHDDAEV